MSTTGYPSPVLEASSAIGSPCGETGFDALLNSEEAAMGEDEGQALTSSEISRIGPMPLRELPMVKQHQTMARLWRSLASIYGAERWLAQYPSEAMEHWRKALGSYTLDEIARGVQRCNGDDSRYGVPKLGQFAARCREYNRGTFAGNALPGAKPIGEVVASLETARMWAGECRKALRGES